MSAAHPEIQPFLDYLRFEKRYSQHTVTAYEGDLVAFFDYIVTDFGGMPLEEITHGTVRSWLAGSRDAGMSAKTLNRKISTLRSFFKYALKTGRLQRSPMLKVTAPKPEKRLPQFVAEGDMQKLWDPSLIVFPDTWKGRTEALLLRLLYETGMRRSEVISLREAHVNAAGSALKVLGKGNKERIIPVSAGLLQAIREYGEEKRVKIGRTDTVLVTDAGKPLPPRAVYASVKKYLDAITTIEKRSPHVLRHSFATHLVNNGAELNAVKELLGHSSLAATQVYTHNTIEKLKDVHKNFHPKA
jgi:integrase/recombinase XerC